MKQTITKLLGGALFALLFLVPQAVKADVTTLASWTFDTGYDVSDNVYTPNASDADAYSAATAHWFNAGAPIIRANTILDGGNTSNYYVTGKTSRYWYLRQDNYSNAPCGFHVVYDTEANDISDYTDASQHNNYIEINFTTTSYKNINLSYKLEDGLNQSTEVTVVSSTDGGTTWNVVGTFNTSSTWYGYNSDSKTLIGTANKSNVKVRLIAQNGIESNLKIDEITVTGEYATVFAEEYTLTTSVTPTSAGKITRSPNAAAYEENTVVSLTATPNIGYAFVEWQDGLGNTLSTANPYDVTMTENKTIVAVYEFAPIAAGTEVTAASWTFDTGYDVSAGVYTPNTSEWEVIDWKWNNTDKVVANKTINTASNYTVWSKTKRAWSIREVNSKKVYAFYTAGDTDGANNISDYANGENHNLFVEFAFPTKGLEDINIDLDFSANSGAKFELVYSTDNGTNWIYKVQYSGGTNEDISIDAADNDKVLVRLIEENGKLDQLNINYFKVKGIISTTTVSISDAKYATYYNSIPVQLPANLQAATIDNETSGTLTLNYRYGEGDVIPGGTAVLLKGTAAGDYTLTMQPAYVTPAPTGNLLHGSDIATTTTCGEKYYALMNGSKGLGFYYKVANGAAFEIGAHKAWLALPAATAHFFSLDDDVTAINKVEMKKVEDGVFYNLAGQQVAQPTKGLYIVNGKKVVIK